MKEQEIKVLVADQHSATRSEFIKSIKTIYPKAIFDESEDGASTLLLLNKENFDLAIIDENIPILKGLDVIEKYEGKDTIQTNFILMSDKHNYNGYQQGVKLGVNYYVDKMDARQDLVNALDAIETENKFLSKSLTEEIKTIQNIRDKVVKLSPNERIFLEELKKGKSIQEISDQLVISSKSVAQIIKNICAMLDIPAEKQSLLNWVINHKHYFK